MLNNVLCKRSEYSVIGYAHTREGEPLLLKRRVSLTPPELELAQIVAAGDGCAVRADCARDDFTLMPLQRRPAFSRCRVPQLQALVKAARQQQVVMNRAERASTHRFGVAGQRATANTGGGISYVNVSSLLLLRIVPSNALKQHATTVPSCPANVRMHAPVAAIHSLSDSS